MFILSLKSFSIIYLRPPLDELPEELLPLLELPLELEPDELLEMVPELLEDEPVLLEGELYDLVLLLREGLEYVGACLVVEGVDL
jgi:hypothetical protein